MPALYVVNGRPASCEKCVQRMRGAYYVPDGRGSETGYVVAKYGYCLIKHTTRRANAKPCEWYTRRGGE